MVFLFAFLSFLSPGDHFLPDGPVASPGVSSFVIYAEMDSTHDLQLHTSIVYRNDIIGEVSEIKYLPNQRMRATLSFRKEICVHRANMLFMRRWERRISTIEITDSKGDCLHSGDIVQFDH